MSDGQVALPHVGAENGGTEESCGELNIDTVADDHRHSITHRCGYLGHQSAVSITRSSVGSCSPAKAAMTASRAHTPPVTRVVSGCSSLKGTVRVPSMMVWTNPERATTEPSVNTRRWVAPTTASGPDTESTPRFPLPDPVNATISDRSPRMTVARRATGSTASRPRTGQLPRRRRRRPSRQMHRATRTFAVNRRTTAMAQH